MTLHEIYGGDAKNKGELCYGDIFTVDMLSEAFGLVYDGKHKIIVLLPKENMSAIQTESCFHLKPTEVLYDKDKGILRMYGIELSRIKIDYKQRPKLLPAGVWGITTTVTCGENVCKIYTTIE